MCSMVACVHFVMYHSSFLMVEGPPAIEACAKERVRITAKEIWKNDSRKLSIVRVGRERYANRCFTSRRRDPLSRTHGSRCGERTRAHSRHRSGLAFAVVRVSGSGTRQVWSHAPQAYSTYAVLPRS